MGTLVTSKGQVTIPKRVRDQLGIRTGTSVEFEMTPDGQVILRKTSGALPPSRFERMRGTATSGMTTDEIMAMTRGEN